MTERRLQSPRQVRRPSTRATTIKVTVASLTAAAALTGGLAVQMASGHDPALGSAGTTSASRNPHTGKGVSSDNALNVPTDNALNASPPAASVVTRSS